MIHIGSIQSFFEKHREEILKLVYNDQAKPKGLENTKVIYLDKKGRTYRQWENENDIPIERYGKVLEYIQYISKGLTAQEEEKLDAEIEEALEDGLKDDKKKSVVRIGAVLNEKKLRRKLCIHTVLIYNYLAVQWCREDENPGVFDNEIQMDKVETLMEENKDGAVSFFFQQRELKKLIDLLGMSKEDWERYTNEFQVQTQRLKELLRLTASKRLSNAPEKTSGK